ncbi:MAG TPA: PIF1 family DEAD/DEAH box helicase [Bdellovibrionota bacterium]|nr:PIF1 family DEAD/DEAH box helicase [Bdellovibrionota bacterium]
MTQPLSACQQAAMSVLEAPVNAFVTGSAGSGKSFLIRRFLADKDPKEYPVLASTGAAAILVGGRTFHSFFGLGIMQGGLEQTVERAARNKRLVKRIQKARAVIVDEISMLSGITLRAAERVARLARGKQSPWGGLRVIAVGDFAQLPPVSQYGTGNAKDWAFLDQSWQISCFAPAVLKTIVRTQEAPFLEILNFVREGRFNERVREFLQERAGSLPEDDGATRLFPHRETTERFNLERLSRLAGETRAFPTEYFGEERFVLDLKRNAPVPEQLQLKEKALVMIRQNDPAGRWVNGSLGHIVTIEDERLLIALLSGRVIELEKAAFTLMNADGAEVASAKNFPVNLAYASTIHKAQGMTLDRVVVDLSKLWEPGHAYVALSRVRTSEGLHVAAWTPSSIKADPNVAEFNRALWESEAYVHGVSPAPRAQLTYQFDDPVSMY